MYKRLKFQQNEHELEAGISQLEVLRSLPTLEEYNEEEEYALVDPKQLDQNNTDQ